MAATMKIQKLRFPEFESEWEIKKVEQVLKRVGKPVTVENDQKYQQIGIRSHGKGLFHKELVTGEELGGKRVFWVVPDSFIVNIVFAWEQAVAKTTSLEKGMIASHRFPMFQSQEKHPVDLDFILYFFLTKKGKAILEAASPGGAGRNKTLGQKEFERQKIFYPVLPEQKKIAAFLRTIDTRIHQLNRKKALLEQYKKGVMQQIFSQEIRFKNDDGKEFSAWEEKKAKTVFRNHTNKNHNGDLPILAITQDKGVVPRDSIDKEIQSSESSVLSYKIVMPGDFVISLRSFQGGIEYCKIMGICSPAYTVLRASIEICNAFFKQYLKKESFIRQLKNTVVGIREGKQISFDAFSGLMLPLPTLPEQQKIANFLSTLDRQINQMAQQLERMQTFKKGLLQQMFV